MILAVITSIVINLFASVPLPSSSMRAVQVDPDGCLPVRRDEGESSAPHSLSGIHFSFIKVAVTYPHRTEVSRLFYEGPRSRYLRLCQPHVVSVTYPSSPSSFFFFFVTLKKHKVHS